MENGTAVPPYLHVCVSLFYMLVFLNGDIAIEWGYNTL